MLLIPLIPILAHAGMVRTLDGRMLEGAIGFDRDQLTITPATGQPPVRVPWADCYSAIFKSSPAVSESGPGRWIGRDLGKVAAPGSARFENQRVILRGSGSGIAETADSGYFIHQRLEGDGQIIARVVQIQGTTPRARAGVMIRAYLEPNAPCAMAVACLDLPPRFRYRTRAGAPAGAREGNKTPLPCWVRLVRRGNEFSSFCSSDGQNWEPLGTETIRMPTSVLAGLVVSSQHDAIVCTATIDQVRLTPANPRPDFNALGLRRIILRNGCELAGQIVSANDSVISIRRDREYRIPLTEVSAIILSSARIPFPAESRRGVLLANGDFFGGTLTRIDGGSITLSSVLFGLKRFEMSRVAMIVLRAFDPGPAEYELRALDGSRLFCEQVSFEKDTVRAEVPIVGQLRLALTDIAELSLASGRLTALTSLRAADPSSARILPDPSRPSPIRPFRSAISVPRGGSITYSAASGSRALAFHAVVPPEVPGSVAVRFIVLADGRELYRSPPRRSFDEALPVIVPLKEAGSVTLKVDAPGESELSGWFCEPVLVR